MLSPASRRCSTSSRSTVDGTHETLEPKVRSVRHELERERLRRRRGWVRRRSCPVLGDTSTGWTVTVTARLPAAHDAGRARQPSQPIPSLSPSNRCGSGCRTLNRRCVMSPQSRSGGDRRGIVGLTGSGVAMRRPQRPAPPPAWRSAAAGGVSRSGSENSRRRTTRPRRRGRRPRRLRCAGSARSGCAAAARPGDLRRSGRPRRGRAPSRLRSR